MTSELGSMWYERKMEDFVGQNVPAVPAVRAQGATTQPRAGKIFCVGDTSFENYCKVYLSALNYLQPPMIPRSQSLVDRYLE